MVAIEDLPDVLKKVLYFRFFRSMTLEEVGTEIGYNRFKVSCLEAKALRMLRHPKRIKKLSDLIEGY